MTAAEEIQLFGEDVLVDDAGLARVSASGELGIARGIRTALQDIMLRLMTPLGSLFYDREFGSRIINFVKDENTMANRMALEAEIKQRVAMDARVMPLSVSASILGWDPTGIKARTTFSLINVTHAMNLVIQVGDDMDMVISDVSTD